MNTPNSANIADADVDAIIQDFGKTDPKQKQALMAKLEAERGRFLQRKNRERNFERKSGRGHSR